MTRSTIRNYALLLLTISFASVASRAASASSPSLANSTGTTSLGLPDRDVVRDPYGTYVPTPGGFILPQVSSIIGPNLGLGAGYPPSLLLGSGGGGGGGSASFGFGAGSAPSFSAPPASTLPQGGSSNNSTGSGGSSIPSTTVTFSAQTDQSTVASVPESGASVILMGAGLLALGALRRVVAFRR